MPTKENVCLSLFSKTIPCASAWPRESQGSIRMIESSFPNHVSCINRHYDDHHHLLRIPYLTSLQPLHCQLVSHTVPATHGKGLSPTLSGYISCPSTFYLTFLPTRTFCCNYQKRDKQTSMCAFACPKFGVVQAIRKNQHPNQDARWETTSMSDSGCARWSAARTRAGLSWGDSYL